MDLAGQGYARLLASVKNKAGKVNQNGKPDAPGDLLIEWASDSVPRNVQWLWPDRVPIGKLTTFAGWGGLGKSFVTMDLAARISRGALIPGSKTEKFQRSKVLILNTEDDPDDTSVPRLLAAGADLTQIAFARSEVLGQFTLADLDTLNEMIAQMGDVRLLVIDPATAHLGDANDHRNAELRALLMPLSLWAMERNLAVILVTHVNKPQTGKVEAMARVVGSVAWVNAVRAAVIFSKDPDDKTRRLFIPFKSNNAPEPKGLAYKVVPADSLPAYPWLTRLAKVDWLGEVDISADEAMNHMEKKTSGQEAVEWITERFIEQGEWESNELRRLAKDAGVSLDAIFKGPEVKALPIRKRPRIDANGIRCWTWIAKYPWPKKEAESSESSESSTVTQDEEITSELSPDSKSTNSNTKVPKVRKSPSNSRNFRKAKVGPKVSSVYGIKTSVQLSEDSELSEGPEEQGKKSLKADATKLLLGMLMGGAFARDKIVVAASERGIPFHVLMEASVDMEVKSSVVDGQEMWSTSSSAIAKTYVTQEADYFGIKVMIATMAGRVEAVGVASILNALPPDKTLAGSLTAQQFVAAVETNGIYGTAYLIKTDAFIRYCQMHRSPQLDRFHDWVTTVIMDVQNRGSHINTNAGPSAYVPERYKDDPILQMMGVLQDQRVRMLDLRTRFRFERPA